MNTSFVLPLFLWGAAGHGERAVAQSQGTFATTGDIATQRFGHTATLLANGKVLVAGGDAVLPGCYHRPDDNASDVSRDGWC